MRTTHVTPGCSDEGNRQLTPVEAIIIQQELKRCEIQPVTAGPYDRMFIEQYALPTQMLRHVESQSMTEENNLSPSCGKVARKRFNNFSHEPTLIGVGLNRVEPYANCVHANHNGVPKFIPRCALGAGGSPFPSIAARLENDVALGLAASLWSSGDVVGHCDDRLAHLLVLSANIVQCRKHMQCKGGDMNEACSLHSVSVKLRHEFMKTIEHLVYFERSVAGTVLLISPDVDVHQAKRPHNVVLPEAFVGQQTHGSSSAEMSVSILGVVSALKGFIEPLTFSDEALAAPSWQFSLVRTAADVPSRYDIAEAMACTLEPCPGLQIPRVYCAVARQLALDLLRAAGRGSVGDRGAAAAVRILQYINTTTECLCSEEREACQCFLLLLERRLRYLTGMLSPESVDEAVRPTRELVATCRLFCGNSPVCAS